MVIADLQRELCGWISKTDVQELIAYELGIRRSELATHAQQELTDLQQKRICDHFTRRLNGEPLQYILGEWDFYGRTFRVTPGVLIPRADTETLIDAAKQLLQPGDEILDLCTGSGCIPITLTLEVPETKAIALELYPAAVELASQNATALSAPVTVRCANVLSEPNADLIGRFPVITANPPYIRSCDMATLPIEVQFEPKEALDGGVDGLIFYRFIANVWKPCLKKGGKLVLEIGYDQAIAVTEILWQEGFRDIKTVQDAGGNDRVIIGTLDN